MYPKILELGPITLHSYGLLLALAFLAATALLARLAVRAQVPASRAWDLAFVVILSSLVGAKLLMVLNNFNYYLSQPSRLVSLEFLQAGGAYFGGLIGAILGSYWYISRSSDLEFPVMADAAAPAIALGQTIGRLGCFGAGCDYGKPTSQPWGVTFTSEYANQNVGVPLNVTLHPTQLYESAGALLLFFILLWTHGRRHFAGQVFATYLMGYGLLRFVNEFFRGDRDRGLLLDGQVSVHQLIAIGLILAALIIFYSARKKSNPQRA